MRKKKKRSQSRRKPAQTQPSVLQLSPTDTSAAVVEKHFEATNIKYRNSLNAYEAQVEKIRKAGILKFKIKWMETSIKHAQMQLEEIDPDTLLEEWANPEDFDPLVSDADFALVMKEQSRELS